MYRLFKLIGTHYAKVPISASAHSVLPNRSVLVRLTISLSHDVPERPKPAAEAAAAAGTDRRSIGVTTYTGIQITSRLVTLVKQRLTTSIQNLYKIERPLGVAG